MRTSEQIDKIAEALAAAQGEMKNPEKNRTANINAYAYNYADLPSTFDCVREVLAKSGLAHSETIDLIDGHVFLIARLIHKSGQWLESIYPLPRGVDDKKLAASLTYGRRYLFSGLVGVAGDDDTDSEPEQGAKYTDIRGNDCQEKKKIGDAIEESLTRNTSKTPITTPKPSIGKGIPVIPVQSPGAFGVVIAPVTNAALSIPALAQGETPWRPTFKELAEVQTHMGGTWTPDYFKNYLRANFQKDRLGDLTHSEYSKLIGEMRITGVNKLNPPNWNDGKENPADFFA